MIALNATAALCEAALMLTPRMGPPDVTCICSCHIQHEVTQQQNMYWGLQTRAARLQTTHMVSADTHSTVNID